jgi:hypothetical protein
MAERWSRPPSLARPGEHEQLPLRAVYAPIVSDAMPRRSTATRALLDPSLRGCPVARSRSQQRHLGTYDKAGAPYIYHPLRLMMRLERREKMIAVLHDVVEDTHDAAEPGARAFRDRSCARSITTKREDEDHDAFMSGEGSLATRKLLDLDDNSIRASPSWRMPIARPRSIADRAARGAEKRSITSLDEESGARSGRSVHPEIRGDHVTLALREPSGFAPSGSRAARRS